LINLILLKRKRERESLEGERQEVTLEFGRHLEKKFYTPKFRVLHYRCWGPSSSEGPQKHDLTMFLEYNT
jgi:hypothetical protein